MTLNTACGPLGKMLPILVTLQLLETVHLYLACHQETLGSETEQDQLHSGHQQSTHHQLLPQE